MAETKITKRSTGIIHHDIYLAHQLILSQKVEGQGHAVKTYKKVIEWPARVMHSIECPASSFFPFYFVLPCSEINYTLTFMTSVITTSRITTGNQHTVAVAETEMCTRRCRVWNAWRRSQTARLQLQVSCRPALKQLSSVVVSSSNI